MSAWADIQQDWATKTEVNEKTGVLLWDLSAAFDTLDVTLLCKKLKLYGFDNLSVKWFYSFLSNRRQKVKIGHFLGCPPGTYFNHVICNNFFKVIILYTCSLFNHYKSIRA